VIKQLAHACIPSLNLQITEDFYCSVLGFLKKFEFIREGAAVGFYLEIGNGTYLEVFLVAAAVESSRQRHLCLEVDDIDVVIERMKNSGIDYTDKKLGADQTWQIWIKDPIGIDIEFHQYTDESTQITGENCLVDW